MSEEKLVVVSRIFWFWFSVSRLKKFGKHWFLSITHFSFKIGTHLENFLRQWTISTTKSLSQTILFIPFNHSFQHNFSISFFWLNIFFKLNGFQIWKRNFHDDQFNCGLESSSRKLGQWENISKFNFKV